MPVSTLSKKHCRDIACSISVDGIADDGSAEVMKEQILDLELFEDGDRALIAVDIAELSRIFADDYVRYDESGRGFSRQTDNVLRRDGKWQIAASPLARPVEAQAERSWKL